MAILLKANFTSILLQIIICACLFYSAKFTSFHEVVSAKIPLNKGWFVWNANKTDLNFTANVPFTVHNRLLAEGYLQDPYYRFNDMKYTWIAADDWVFSITFDGTKAILLQPRINVVLESIDTVADVYFNGVKVGASQDKFLKYEFEITSLIQHGVNKIELMVKSPTAFALQQSKSYLHQYGYPVLPNCYPEVLHGECHSNFIRKEPCSFGWDFGPGFPTQGLFGSVYVEGFQVVALGESVINTIKGINGWIINVCVDLHCHIKNVTVFMEFEVLEDKIAKEKHLKFLLEPDTKVCATIHVGNDKIVKEWWPHQYGNQDMYTLQVTVYDTSGQKLQKKLTQFGFRTVELIQEPIPYSEGLSFYFRINDIEIFLKGSNWIPADALRDRVTNETIEVYLQSAIAANINVLRVWGGGGFESDYFYETCDKLGLLIWQDFMFACAMYPTNLDFLDLVKNETAYQLKRLNRHPSIIVWSANNENEIALRENWYGTSNDFAKYKADYVKLYVNNIKEVVKSLDKTRPFVVSSPSNGIESEREGWIAREPWSALYGDVHVYNYTANCWDPEVFPKPRFASEYGYQSYPSVESFEKVSVLSDRVWNSTLMFYRQHHQDGNKQIEAMIKQNFQLPKATDKFIFFKQMVYMSQIVQSLCVTFETEHYRRLRGRLVKQRLDTYVPNDEVITVDVLQQESTKRKKRLSSPLGALSRAHPDRLEGENDYNDQESIAVNQDIPVHDQSNHVYSDSSVAMDHHGDDSIAVKQNISIRGNNKSMSSNAKQHLLKANNDLVAERNTRDTLFGHTMGAMYWQLNDIWQAPSWASIEYGGKWKMLHYYAANFFRDLSVSYHKRGDKMDIFVVSDLLTTVSAYMNVTAFNWSSLKWTRQKSYPIKVPSQISTLLMTLSLNDWCDRIEDCFLILSVNVTQISKYSYARPVFVSPFSIANSLRDPKVTVSEIVQLSSKTIGFTVQVQCPAPFLWLDSPIPGHFSDNGFLQFERTKKLKFFARNDVTADDFTRSLRHMSLYDTTVE